MRLLIVVLLAILYIGMPSCNSSEDRKEKPEQKEIVVNVQRYGSVIKLKPEKLKLYKDLHANTWPGVLKQITKSNIRNYSIYLKDGYLFSYFEYVGDDFKKDMELMAADSTTKEWWKVTDPCQEPLETRAPGEWWAKMEEVFHHD